LLLDGDLVEAGSLSERINSAMLKLRNSLESIPGVRVDLFGGDDLVAAATDGALSLSKLDQLREDSTLTAAVRSRRESATRFRKLWLISGELSFPERIG
jgi:hypothetical protein